MLFILSSLFPRDALIVSFTNSFTSILAGFVIFSAIGYMAHIHNLPVDNIATDGKYQAWRDHHSLSWLCFILSILNKKTELWTWMWCIEIEIEVDMKIDPKLCCGL